MPHIHGFPGEVDPLAAAQRWDPDASAVRHLRDGENSTWEVAGAAGAHVLRLTREAHRTKDQLEAELDFIEHVAVSGLPVARPRSAPGGERVLEVADGVFAVLFPKLPGRPFEFHSADIGAPLFRAWGETMARLHACSIRFRPREGFHRPEWLDDRLAGCPDRGSLPAPLSRACEELLAWVRALPPDPRHYGMVHGDFERTNFLLDGGTIRVFDFDDCCRHWFAWDVACALWVFRHAPQGERARMLAWFLEGYAAVRPPDHERLSRFSDWIRLRTLALLIRRLPMPGDRLWVERAQAWLATPWRW
jgi:Ser/Thr protein kinase RdoA (MazF antagonist)